MVKCPNCGKDITEVVKDTSYTNARQIEIYKIENGEVTSKVTDTDFKYIILVVYYCPLCREEIGDEDFNVYAFLEGRNYSD